MKNLITNTAQASSIAATKIPATKNPHARITKYRVFLYNVKTGERQTICAAGRDLMTKGEADRLIKKAALTMAPWVYAKEAV